MLVTLTVVRNYIQSYYDTVFRRGYFVGIVTMLAVIIFLNYNYSFAQSSTWWGSLLSDYLLYLLPFAFAYALQWFYFTANRSNFSKPWFWILLLTAPAIFAVRSNINLPATFLPKDAVVQINKYFIAVSGYTVRALFTMFAVFIIWFIKDRKNYPLYGFAVSRNNKLYFLLLAFMAPLILLAATFPDFLRAYPKAMSYAGLNAADNFAKWVFFELSYALDFLSIEFFFRGFLIIAFIRFCGMRAIIPAACFYCCIHLGKPMAEAVSSFFGGLLLGIISYHTLSIWGGLFIHIGIAWLMELVSYTVHHF